MYSDQLCIRNKLPEFKHLPDMIFLVESWYHPENISMKLNYIVIFFSCMTWRGKIIQMTSEKMDIFNCDELNDSTRNVKECHFLLVEKGENPKISTTSLYRKGNFTEKNYRNLLMVLNKVVDIQNEVIMMGDFNFPSISWMTHSTSLSENSEEQQFLDSPRNNFNVTHQRNQQRQRQPYTKYFRSYCITNDD